ncbi:MAG: hypothetical protein AAF871_09330 [Pseudomonadota bacterium]
MTDIEISERLDAFRVIQAMLEFSANNARDIGEEALVRAIEQAREAALLEIQHLTGRGQAAPSAVS